MIQIKAIFDGEKIVLPPYVRGRISAANPVTVIVEFPEGAIAEQLEDAPPFGSVSRPARSVWDIIKDDYRSKRTLDEALRELEEGRDADDRPPGGEE